MANRSYLYTADHIPGSGPDRGRIEDLSEWGWEIPALHRVLLTGSPELCPSVIWTPPVQAIIGDYDEGVANLERFFAALPQTDAVRGDAAAALALLQNPVRRRRCLLLEVGEIIQLSVPTDPDEDPDQWATEVAEAVEMELAEIGEIDHWIAYARTLREDDTKKLVAATGGNWWPRVNYFSLGVADTAAAEPRPPGELPPHLQAGPPADLPTAISAQLATVYPPPAEPSAEPAPPTQPYGPPTPLYGPPAVPQSGSLAWALGFLALIPFPVVASIVAGIVMVLVGRSQRRHGPSAAAVGRNAGNWGFTYLVLSVILWTLHFVLLYVLTKDGPMSGFYPMGTILTVWFALTLAHAVICGIGTARAGKGVPFTVPAIPLLRG